MVQFVPLSVDEGFAEELSLQGCSRCFKWLPCLPCRRLYVLTSIHVLSNCTSVGGGVLLLKDNILKADAF
jgi:hypothetical protein